MIKIVTPVTVHLSLEMQHGGMLIAGMEVFGVETAGEDMLTLLTGQDPRVTTTHMGLAT
jgi:hypothetical protein